MFKKALLISAVGLVALSSATDAVPSMPVATSDGPVDVHEPVLPITQDTVEGNTPASSSVQEPTAIAEDQSAQDSLSNEEPPAGQPSDTAADSTTETPVKDETPAAGEGNQTTEENKEENKETKTEESNDDKSDDKKDDDGEVKVEDNAVQTEASESEPTATEKSWTDAVGGTWGMIAIGVGSVGAMLAGVVFGVGRCNKNKRAANAARSRTYRNPV